MKWKKEPHDLQYDKKDIFGENLSVRVINISDSVSQGQF